tara:strand:- start:102 stop:359 length:258 start_codon:yes stop_codon:yes gene_type:complete
MKKITYVLLALTALFINSTAHAVEARIPTASITQALQNARSKDNFADLKNVKFDVEQKVYNISYITKSGDVEILKISKVTGKEIK